MWCIKLYLRHWQINWRRRSRISSMKNNRHLLPDIITDNVLVAYECLHYMRTKWSKRNAYCALKLDMAKAYDRIESKYLEAVVLKLGFNQSWVDKVMKCVTTVSFLVLFNGEKLEDFKPTRESGRPDFPIFVSSLCRGTFMYAKRRRVWRKCSRYRSLKYSSKDQSSPFCWW